MLLRVANEKKNESTPAHTMEFQQLENAASVLESVTANFPCGAKSLDDLKPVEIKIAAKNDSYTI